MTTTLKPMTTATKLTTDTDRDIITTAGEIFTKKETVNLARLVFKRFGNDLDSATDAWQRLLQNNCSPVEFLELLEEK